MREGPRIPVCSMDPNVAMDGMEHQSRIEESNESTNALR